MKNFRKNIKGITLVSLMITVIVLLILASIGTYSGIEVIKSSKFTKFTTEMKIMQTQVNALYEKYKDNEIVEIDGIKYYGENSKEDETLLTILDLGEELTDSIEEQAAKVFSECGIEDNTGYKYWNIDLIEKLGIEGVEEEFFVNIEKRSIVSYKGFKYEGTTYYTLEQIPNGLYNVEYEENTNIPEFKTSVEAIEKGKWKVSVSDIVYDGYIDKWEVEYKLEGQENWNTTESMNFTVNEEGVYIVTVSNKDVTINEKRIAVGVAELEPEQSSLTALSTMLYGVIEVEFLDSTGYKSVTLPNKPILKDGMKAVYWSKDENGEIDSSTPANNTYEMTSDATNFKKGNWYQYLAQTGNTDGKTSRWANAMTSDGSYYVWIPRYAYRIIYFDSKTNEDAYRAGTLTEEAALESGAIVGYSDARGIVDQDGKRPSGVESTTAISINDKYFRTHPVFDGNVDEGGWDSKLEGIWVMKYEASREDADETSRGTGTIPKSVPNVQPYNQANVSTMFTIAKNLNTTLNTHMMKDSEWGAVAYLADSKYGRNGVEVSVNQCLTFITGAGRGNGDNEIYNSAYEWNDITEQQKYNGTIGQLSSSTGNIYGIYDMSGGAYEYMMGFYQNESGNIYIGESASVNSGFNGYLGDGTEKKDGIEFPIEKKYYQVYQRTYSSGEDLGYAFYETNGWNYDTFLFITTDNPIIKRGGNADWLATAGIFNVYQVTGKVSAENTFRVCLAINE